MSDKEKNDVKKWLLIVTYGLVLWWLLNHYMLLVGGVRTIVSVLAPFIAGVILAYLLNLMMMFYERHLFIPWSERSGKEKKKNWIRMGSIVTTLLTIGALMGLLINFIIPQLGDSISTLMDNVPAYRDSLMLWLQNLAATYPFLTEGLNDLTMRWELILQQIAEMLSDVAPKLVSWTKSLTTGIFTILMGLIVSIYLLAGKEKYLTMIQNMLYAYFPQKRADTVMEVAALTNRSFSRFISGQLTEITILGCLCFFGMHIFGMPYPLLISVMIAVTALIPIFGAYLGTIPSAFLILMIDPMQAVWFIIFIVVLQQIEGKIIYPRVVGYSIGLGGFWVLFALLVGGSLFGLPGMLIGIPIFAVLYAMVRKDMYKRLAVKKMMQKG